MTEIHDYLRLLPARIGDPHCPDHNILLPRSPCRRWSITLTLPEDTRLMILPADVDAGEQVDLFDELRAQGFVRLRIDGEVHETTPPKLKKNTKHTVEVAVDRLKAGGRPAAPCRIARDRVAPRRRPRSPSKWTAGKNICSRPNRVPGMQLLLPELEPRLFSFNN